ncbi:PEGA domain-containing protein [Candidatus Saccharibacteria bacterium]|nr:PEGA domain-containing protein [Candidatus Saccharibacteria bacterium]
MNPEQSRRQTIRIIVSEAFMVVAVIITVIVLALLVSGYWLNSNFEIERNGMLQISSIPTGANVEIDNQSSSWLERTNSSKILASGPHTVRLTKDGYDSWSKDINIAEGLLYRLHYPRLFLQKRQLETVMDTSKYTSASVSSDHNAILLINNTSEWGYLDLDTDSPSLRSIDISSVFSSVSLAENAKVGLFAGEIMSVNWDYDASHVLIHSRNGDASEWVLLDVKNVAKSINLTKEFGVDFSHVEIIDNNSNTLLVVQNHNLHKIDVPGRLVSAVLVKNIIDFDHYNNEIVFSARHDSVEPSQNIDKEYYIGYYKLGDREISSLEQLDAPAQVAIGKFYDSKYIATLIDTTIVVHQKDDYQGETIAYELSFIPDTVTVGHDGEFLLLTKEHTLATLDFESTSIREWPIEGEFDWLDNDMLYAIRDGNLVVYDYDGLNRRELASNALGSFPVTITNDRWLYYFRDNHLVREWLIVK